jgi:hypothetical protein
VSPEQKAEALANIRRDIREAEEDLALLHRLESAVENEDLEAGIAAYADAVRVALLRKARQAKGTVAAPTQGKAEA